MEMRRHSKLMSKVCDGMGCVWANLTPSPFFPLFPRCIQNKIKAAVVKARNSNPMRNRAATGLKAKPMPATATLLVKAVWHGYFFGAKVQNEEEEGEEKGGARVGTMSGLWFAVKG